MKSSDISFEYLTVEDFSAVLPIYNQSKKYLGFLPNDALRDYLNANGVIGAKSSTGDLLGYIMFARYPDRIRLAQICVDTESQGLGLAQKLVESLTHSAKTEKLIKLKCRRDYPAHSFWAKVGFIPFGECRGKSADGSPLTSYCYILDSSDELNLWKTQLSENTVQWVIDAQIFFDFYEPESEKSIPSKSLLNDSLGDSINLWIIDELLTEIDRCQDKQLREKSRTRANGFQRIEYKRELTSKFESYLKEILPHSTANQLSDIRQIAKAASSDAEFFITNDQRIINAKHDIAELTGLKITTPSELITSVYKQENQQFYSPSYIAGLSLFWKRFTAEDITQNILQSFLLPSESQGKIRQELQSYLARPDLYQCELLESHGNLLALRVVAVEDQALSLHCIRVSRNANAQEGLIANFVLADSFAFSTKNQIPLTFIQKQSISSAISLSARKLHLHETDNQFIKPILPQVTTPEQTITQLQTLLDIDFSSHAHSSLEKLCSPLVVDPNTSTFLISIKPSYARQMIDQVEASNELFIEKSTVLLSSDNVYYKKKSSHKMLQAPGRILWYVSGDNARIIATSCLDEVTIGEVKTLFKKYSKYGVLEWRDLYDLTNKDLGLEIMALRFSQTYSFAQSISREQLLNICKEEGFNLALPSPTAIPYSALKKLYTLGFPH